MRPLTMDISVLKTWIDGPHPFDPNPKTHSVFLHKSTITSELLILAERYAATQCWKADKAFRQYVEEEACSQIDPKGCLDLRWIHAKAPILFESSEEMSAEERRDKKSGILRKRIVHWCWRRVKIERCSEALRTLVLESERDEAEKTL